VSALPDFELEPSSARTPSNDRSIHDSLVGRYYDPGTGQFLSVDPLVDVTGQPYAYTGDDPVNGVDPSGDTEGIGPLVSLLRLLSTGIANVSSIFGLHGSPPPGGFGQPSEPAPSQVRPVRPEAPQNSGQGGGQGGSGSGSSSNNSSGSSGGSGNSANDGGGSSTIGNPCVTSFEGHSSAVLVDCGGGSIVRPGEGDDGDSDPFGIPFVNPFAAAYSSPCDPEPDYVWV
jgi:uncharacterized protein RhaS with RHS repeats